MEPSPEQVFCSSGCPCVTALLSCSGLLSLLLGAPPAGTDVPQWDFTHLSILVLLFSSPANTPSVPVLLPGLGGLCGTFWSYLGGAGRLWGSAAVTSQRAEPWAVTALW